MPVPDFSDIEQRINDKYPNVDLTYNWDYPPTNQAIRNFYGEPIDGLTEEEFTVRLFQKFNEAFQNAAGNKDRIKEIINLIVYHWGGIHGNHEETIERYADNLINGNLQEMETDTGIASKSKILAAWNPNHYYIYDARVAIALQKLYFNIYRFYIPTPQGNVDAVREELERSQGEAVTYPEFCEGLRNTQNGSQLEKKLFMLGGYIEENGLK
ncbi:MAG: hypothetical protein IJS14_04785 [Lentisphaeria bacterium]|nr:hypothetical protein [Lentisphaeria bacterium]